MISIQQALSDILASVYGRDVRNAIHDAIYQINENANEAVDLSQIKFGNAVIAPTSSTTGYREGTVYFNTSTGIIWRLSGGAWAKQGNLKAIDNIAKTATAGLVDTYTITYNDGTASTFNVENGENGVSVADVRLVGTTGSISHYEVLLSDGTTTPSGFDVANGVSVSNITLASTVGNTKNYDVNLSDGTKTPTGFSVTDGTSNYVHIRYSASFDGTGMVAIPTATTVYIGIVVTTQSNAPTDPSVYNWVKFIGDSGTGTGDMLKSEYATQYAGVVDKAAALYDGSTEIQATQLMSKANYASKGVAGTVDKATELVDTVTSKVANTTVLANLSDASGVLQYKGSKIGEEVKADGTTINKNASTGVLSVAATITNKVNQLNNTAADANKVLTANGDGSTKWEVAKGGHDMLATVPAVEAITSPTDDHVVSAYAIKGYSNRYTIGRITTLTAGNNQVTITDTAFTDDNATYEFFFEPKQNADGEYEYLTLAGYTLDTSTGEMTITVVDAPTVNIRVRVDITTYREEV